MKIHPGVPVLAILSVVTVAFLYAITPAPKHVPDDVNTGKATTTNSLTSSQKRRIAAFANDWSTSPSYDVDFNALDPSYKTISVTDSLFDPSDDFWGLPRDDKGAYELVDAYCSACHSLSIVMQQRATPERWQELLIWMEEKQGMAKLPNEDEELVLDYISTHFSTH